MKSAAQERTDQKLSYAEIHLEELRDYPNATTNNPWENAHQESCFYHLAGAVEGILHEISDGYALELELDDVTARKVKEALRKAGKSSLAFDHIEDLRLDAASWLAQLVEWRNHGAHRRRVGKIVHLSTSQVCDNEFKDPRAGQASECFAGQGCLAVLETLHGNVRALIDECRSRDPRLTVEV